MWRAVDRAVDLGCTALQIFTQTPGRWQGKEISAGEADRFRAAADEADLVGVIFAHAPYLVNVATGDRGLRKRSRDLLVDQLERARLLGLDGLVLHPGAHTGDGPKIGIGRAVKVLLAAMERVPEAPPLLLEVTAGQGTTLGRSFTEIADLLKPLPPDRTGVCWDTAHLWAAEYDVVAEEGWERMWDELRNPTGRRVPDLVHLNDTNVELGSRVDRHERLGHGKLGFDTFSRIVRDPRLARVPMVLETPKGPDEVTWDREALEFLREAARG
jgi:deoxyribonuclease-4